MVDLAMLEEQLNTDAALRQQFLTDPVSVLRRAGLWLSPAQEFELRKEILQVNSQRPYIPGAAANVAPLGTVRLRVASWNYCGKMQ
jgi:hypothetical protein